MPITIQNAEKKLMCAEHKIAKLYCQNQVIYSSGNIVTYMVDANISYQEEVDEGASCLSPKTFTPTKSGWTFVGWRTDTAATASVLSSKIMGDDPITLYAVFQQTITLTYNGNGATGGSTAAQTGTRYYNNGNISNPSFALRSSGFAKTNYNFTKWAMGSASGTQYAAGASVTLAASTTFYAVWVVAAVAINSSVEQQIRNNNGDEADEVHIYTGGRVNNYHDNDGVYVITSGIPDNGTIWTTPRAGVLQNAQLTIYIWVTGQLGVENLADDYFKISKRIIKLSSGQVLVNKDNHIGPTGDLLQTAYSETYNLGNLTLTNNARIYLDTLQVYNWEYDCIGHIRYTITGTLV